MDLTVTAPLLDMKVSLTLHWDDDAKYVSASSGFAGPTRTEGSVHLLSFTDDVLSPTYKTHSFSATYPRGSADKRLD